jgi:hypothetical protein
LGGIGGGKHQASDATGKINKIPKKLEKIRVAKVAGNTIIPYLRRYGGKLIKFRKKLWQKETTYLQRYGGKLIKFRKK